MKPASARRALLAALASALGIIGVAVFGPTAFAVDAATVLAPWSAEVRGLPPAGAASVAPDAEAAPDPLLELERAAATAAQGGGEAARAALATRCAEHLDEVTCQQLVAHPAWGIEGARRTASGEVVLGATAEQVEAAWGPPEKKVAQGARTLWCYDEDCATGMVLLGDRVVALKE